MGPRPHEEPKQEKPIQELSWRDQIGVELYGPHSLSEQREESEPSPIVGVDDNHLFDYRRAIDVQSDIDPNSH